VIVESSSFRSFLAFFVVEGLHTPEVSLLDSR